MSHFQNEAVYFLVEAVREVRDVKGRTRGFTAVLEDGSEEQIKLETIRLGSKNEVYICVQNRGVPFEAKLHVSGAYTLLKHAKEEGERFYLSLSTKRVYF